MWTNNHTKSLQLYSISMNKKEFERFKGLISDEQVHQLSAPKIMNTLRLKNIIQLMLNNPDTSLEHIFFVHDPCDIRKPHSDRLEVI